MNRFTRITTVLVLSLALGACGGDTAEGAGGGEAVHVHGPDCSHEAETTGPHGGGLAAVGDGATRLEALHDDVLGQVTVYILDAEGAMLTLDQPPVLNLVTDEGSLQLKPTQIGGAWVFESDDLLDEPEKARFRIALAGKTYRIAMPCSHEHGADCDSEHGDEHEGHEHGAENEGDEHVEVDHDHATHDDHGHEDGDEDGKGHDDD